MTETTTTETVETAEKFQPLHRGPYGVGLNYASQTGTDALYVLYAQDDNGEWFSVATVSVNKETRAISLNRHIFELPTKGIASLVFENDEPRISGQSVARYVLPRAGVLLARLHTIA